MTRAEHLARQARIAAAVRLPEGDDAAVCSLASTLLAQYAAAWETAAAEVMARRSGSIRDTLAELRLFPQLPWLTCEWIEHEIDAAIQRRPQ